MTEIDTAEYRNQDWDDLAVSSQASDYIAEKVSTLCDEIDRLRRVVEACTNASDMAHERELAARAAALEEAAKITDRDAEQFDHTATNAQTFNIAERVRFRDHAKVCRTIGEKIRALASGGGEKGENHE